MPAQSYIRTKPSLAANILCIDGIFSVSDCRTALLRLTNIQEPAVDRPVSGGRGRLTGQTGLTGAGRTDGAEEEQSKKEEPLVRSFRSLIQKTPTVDVTEEDREPSEPQSSGLYVDPGPPCFLAALCSEQ